MMFSKLDKVFKKPNQVISIDDLFDLVKSNPKKDLVERIRSTEYHSEEFNSLKMQLPCIMPHGEFDTLSNSGIVKLSGYLFFDIDNIEDDMDVIKQKLIDTGLVCFICKSVGGRGLSFLVKYNIKNLERTLSDESSTSRSKILNGAFIQVYNEVWNEFIHRGFTLDNNAKGLNRKWFLSYDLEVFQKVSSLGVYSTTFINDIPKEDNFNQTSRQSNKSSGIKVVEYTPNEDTFKVIPIVDLLKQISLYTQYNKEIEGFYVIDDIQFYDVRIFQYRIPDGKKRFTYFRFVQGLMYINEQITIQQIYSYIHFVNKNYTEMPMIESELIKLIKSTYKRTLETGEIKIKTRSKKIHFNPEKKLTAKQKIKIANQEIANMKVNKSIDKIKDAIEQLKSQGKKVSRRSVSKISGLALSTVDRNWKIAENNQYRIIGNQLPIEEKETILKQIAQEDFFNNTKLNI